MKQTSVVNIYGCGGAGINIAHQFQQYIDSEAIDGFSKVIPIYIDTSTTNLESIDLAQSKNSYVFPGLDGSGKLRKENAGIISKHALDILQKHPAGDLNIVISSSSGGSGSVIAPSIVSELLNNGKNVIVCCVLSKDSVIEINNTVNTLKSYDSISKLRNKPVVMLWAENNKGISLEQINKKFYQDIVYMSALFSKQNVSLDSADLNNWLNYQKVTSFDPSLVTLKFLDNIELGEGETPITVATLALKNHDTAPSVIVEYRCYGFVKDGLEKTISLTTPMHYVILDGEISKIYKRFSEEKNKFDDVKRSRLSIAPLASDDDQAQSNGLIL